MEILTIGYEKASLADFLRTLKGAGAALLVDVRDRPQSRRAGFSKRMLAASAAAEGIDYVHLKPLGTPPEGRLAHRTGDQAAFRRIVEAQLATPAAVEALDALATLAIGRRACVMCYEADWRHCHRAAIIERLEARGFTARHLSVEPEFL